jgi:sigma-B regulation protein RsbU (phosphoserine phosphatase)
MAATPTPLLIRADGTASYPAAPRCLLLGVTDDTTYTAATLRLGPGDTLLLYTDGLTEARTITGGSRYGEDALQAFVSDLGPVTATEAVTALTALLDSFSAGLTDDTAVLALSVPSAK